MVLDVAIQVLLFGPALIVYGNQMFVIIAKLEIGLVKDLILLNMRKHFQCTAALVEVIVIRKQVTEILNCGCYASNCRNRHQWLQKD